MKTAVYSLKKILFQGEVVAINAKTTSGEITVLNHHLPLMTQLEKGVVKITDANREDHFINVGGGFLEVNEENQAKLLVDEVGA